MILKKLLVFHQNLIFIHRKILRKMFFFIYRSSIKKQTKLFKIVEKRYMYRRQLLFLSCSNERLLTSIFLIFLIVLFYVSLRSLPINIIGT